MLVLILDGVFVLYWIIKSVHYAITIHNFIIMNKIEFITIMIKTQSNLLPKQNQNYAFQSQIVFKTIAFLYVITFFIQIFFKLWNPIVGH